MIKKLSLIAALGLASVVSAQDVKVGATGGLGMSTILGDDANDMAMKLSYSAGLMAKIDLESFAIQPEVLYSAKGAANSENSDLKINANYLDINILGAFALTPEFSILAGPQIGVLLSAEMSDGDNEMDLKDNYAGLDYGVLLGGQFQITPEAFAGARMNYGFATLDKDGDAKVNNFGFGIMAGYLF